MRPPVPVAAALEGDDEGIAQRMLSLPEAGDGQCQPPVTEEDDAVRQFGVRVRPQRQPLGLLVEVQFANCSQA